MNWRDQAAPYNATINRSDFGISKFVGPVSDEVELIIEVEFVRE